MTLDELALRYRQWADTELAYLDRMREATGDPRGAFHAERVALRRSVAWIESAANVPTDERLIDGGTRRLRSWETRETGRELADALQASRDEQARGDDGCAPCPDETAVLAGVRAGLQW